MHSICIDIIPHYIYQMKSLIPFIPLIVVLGDGLTSLFSLERQSA